MAAIKKILFIEDDHFISELYARALGKAGYDVKTVVTGPDGLNEAKAGGYDLILLDIMVPDKLGIDVMKELRGPDGTGLPNTKIVIATNLALEDEARTPLEVQADGYLIKADITPKKLIEIIGRFDDGERPAKAQPEGKTAEE